MRYGTARAWLVAVRPQNTGPTALITEVSAALDEALDDLPKAIMRGPAFCLAEVPRKENAFERPDRLPLLPVRCEAQVRENASPADFVLTLLNPGFLRSRSIWSVSDVAWPMRALKVRRCSG